MSTPVKRALPLPQRKTPAAVAKPAAAPSPAAAAKPAAAPSPAMAEMSKRAAATRGIENKDASKASPDGVAPVVVPRRALNPDSPAAKALAAKRAEISAKIASGSVAAPSKITAVTKPSSLNGAKPAAEAKPEEKQKLSAQQKQQVEDAQNQLSQALKEISEATGKEIHIHIHAPVHIHLDSKL